MQAKNFTGFFCLMVSVASLGCESDNGTPTGSGGSGGTGGLGGGSAGVGGGGGTSSTMSFFVTSVGSVTGDLGGLVGADEKCQRLASAVGLGSKTWHAYLSIEKGPNDLPVHAKDRIGSGPWHNAAGALVATGLSDLHARDGDPLVFLDELGKPVPGQWPGSPTPVMHDILTGSNRDGTVKAENTCKDWTSSDASSVAWVGHSDGLGPGASADPTYRPWNSVHVNAGCNDTAPRGGNGRIYCFATASE